MLHFQEENGLTRPPLTPRRLRRLAFDISTCPPYEILDTPLRTSCVSKI